LNLEDSGSNPGRQFESSCVRNSRERNRGTAGDLLNPREYFPIEVNIRGAIGTTKEGGFGALKPMVKRFGVHVTGMCRICGAEGRTEMHHIISASRLGEMDRVDLMRLVTGLLRRRGLKSLDENEWHETLSDDELRKRCIEQMPTNLVELCVPCHRDTDSHRYRQWREDLQAGRDPDARAKRIKKAIRMKFQGRFRCSGTTKRGTSCRYRVEVEGGYCHYHEPRHEGD